MSRKSTPAVAADFVLLPVDAYHGLQAFYVELIDIAQAIDSAVTPASDADDLKQSRRRALARVFRLWADQVHGNLETIRSD